MNLLYFIILIPLISFFILALWGKGFSRGNVAIIGIGSLGIVCLLTTFITIDFYNNIRPDSILIYTRYLWQWIRMDDFNVSVALSLDGLSLTFIFIIAVISFLVLISAVSYIGNKEYYEFFACGNLLVANMFVIVLADNILVMLLGWEGVSLCSYLLIGFYHKQLKNSYAAIRTYIIMHIGDIFLLIGLFLFYGELHTLNIKQLLTLATDSLAIDSDIVIWATLALFLGAISKSVQLPMHIWLTDTTSTPMPALTLIHSASAMLAGIYLIMRLNSLFILSHDVLWLIGLIGCLTLILSSCSALVQNDIKKVITYASLSQICYVFLAISVEAWNEALNYLISYVIFITLFFLSATSLVKICDGERDIRHMALKIKDNPFIYFCFIMIGASISAAPWLTTSFFTKGNILWATVMQGRIGITAIGLMGVLLSTLYIFRLIFILFPILHNDLREQLRIKQTLISYVPLMLLVILSLGIFSQINLPIKGIMPSLTLDSEEIFSFRILLTAITVLGILTTYVLYAGNQTEINDITHSPLGKRIIPFWYSGWRVDALYHKIFIKPYLAIAKKLQTDPLNVNLSLIPKVINRINSQIAKLENGYLRWYITSMVVGELFILLLLVFA
ncbi:MAG: NADH-quinone oxidoreductase subunit L [Candidatus Schmidhempelia sp.]|nr:NADH-quinone oxidoreductase subunit L [Candidatus Schmidhempelia sp.]